MSIVVHGLRRAQPALRDYFLKEFNKVKYKLATISLRFALGVFVLAGSASGTDVTVFSYAGGACPPELTVKDGDPGNVECGVPRSRLFDAASPLDGSLAEATFPGVDDPNQTGMLVRLDNFAVNPANPRANLVIICLTIIIPPQAAGFEWVWIMGMRSAGIEVNAAAQAVIDAGGKNHWAKQARKLKKAEAAAAGGVDPKAARKADRLRRQFAKKNNTDYQVLLDGTKYVTKMDWSVHGIRFVPAVPGQIFTIYIVLFGDAFESAGHFMSGFDVIMSDVPDPDSVFMGDLNDTALVVEFVDDYGPVTIVDFAGEPGFGIFTPNIVDMNDILSLNPQRAVWVTNSSATEDLELQVPGHPVLVLPPDKEVSFNDHGDGGIILGQGSQGSSDTVTIIGLTIPTGACCSPGDACGCQEAVTKLECVGLQGSFFQGEICADVCVDGICIPTMSEWGLVAMTLLVLTAGTIVLMRRRAVAA